MFAQRGGVTGFSAVHDLITDSFDGSGTAESKAGAAHFAAASFGAGVVKSMIGQAGAPPPANLPKF